MTSRALLITLLLSSCAYKVQKEPEAGPEKISGPIAFSRIQAEVLPKCTRCHGWAESYEGVRPLLSEIAARVASRDPGFRMPMPGSPDLTAGERALLLEWIARGGPEGEPGEGTQPEPPVTPPVPPPPALNFAAVKAKVFDAKCLRCHGRDLDTYENARPLLREIDFRVRLEGAGQMPPASRPQLTAEEKQLLLDWIQAGAPEL